MITLKKGDCLELMKGIPDKSIDAIVTDPPYLYLNHRLDRDFDEKAVFDEWDRIVKDDGFIVIFGRGESFYRWNFLLNDLGWKFKEEIIWDKRANSSPMSRIGRVHENAAILTKKGVINRVKVPYVEKNHFDLDLIVNDVKTIKSAIKNSKKLSELEFYLETGETIKHIAKNKHSITGKKKTSNDRSVYALISIEEGKLETSIMRVKREHYVYKVPTQKPVRLMERLLALTTKEHDLVLDPFMGSGSTGLATINLNRKFIGYELDDEYFEIAKERIEKASK